MVFMVARILQQGKLIGFKMIDSDTGKNVNIAYDKLKQAMFNGLGVENLKIENDRIKGKGGSIERYSAITVANELISRQSVVVIGKSTDVAGMEYYRLADYRGGTDLIGHKHLIKYAMFNNTIANGKLCRSSKGIYYISAIEGEYNEEQSVRGVQKTKYKLPRVRKYTQIIDRQFDLAQTQELKKCMKHIVPKLNFESVVHKNGVTLNINEDCIAIPGRRVEGKQSSIAYTYNDFLTSSLNIGITEFSYSDYTHFVLTILTAEVATYIVDDIIFIGENYRSVVTGERYSDIGGDTIVALGQTSLIVVTPYSSIECIPYCCINTVDKLMGQLYKHTEANKLMTKDDIERILYMANNSVYQFKIGIEPEKLFINAEISEDNYKDREQHVYNINSLRLTRFDTLGIKYNTDLDLYATDSILKELEGVSRYFDREIKSGNRDSMVIGFSHSTSLMHKIKKEVGILQRNETHVISLNTLKLKYIAYAVMYFNGIIKLPSEALISSKDLKDIDEVVWYTKIAGDVLSIFVGNNQVDFNLNKLKEQFIIDEAKVEESSIKAKKLNAKLGLIGTDITVNDAGYLVDWGEGENIVQTPSITGIMLGKDNCKKHLTITLTGALDTVDRRGERNWTNNVTLAYNYKSLDELLKSTNIYGGFKRAIDLTDATCEEMQELFAAWFRDKSQAMVVINGRKERIAMERKELTLRTIIANGSKVLSDEVFKEQSYGALKIINADKVDNKEKTKFMQGCLSSIPKRVKSDKNESVKAVKLIIETLYSGENRRAILSNFDIWLTKR